jgi:DNA-binding response OmpR family regulator
MKKVLLVNDDPDSLEVLSTYLRKKNFEILTTSRVTKIFKLIAWFHPSIIILADGSVNGYDGRDLCREIKRYKNAGDIQLLWLINDETKLGSSQCECDDIIIQPVDPALILEKLSLCESGVC